MTALITMDLAREHPAITRLRWARETGAAVKSAAIVMGLLAAHWFPPRWMFIPVTMLANDREDTSVWICTQCVDRPHFPRSRGVIEHERLHEAGRIDWGRDWPASTWVFCCDCSTRFMVPMEHRWRTMHYCGEGALEPMRSALDCPAFLAVARRRMNEYLAEIRRHEEQML